MSKLIRINLTPELITKLREGDTLTFSIPPCACGIDRIEVGRTSENGFIDGLFGNFENMFDGVDKMFDGIFGNKRSSK